MSRRLAKSTGTVSLMTMTSRVLGLVRDIVVAHMFGAGAGIDAFWVAFRIPNFMRRLFAEGAFSQAFVPVLSEYSQTKDPEEVKAFVGDMMGTLGTALLAVTLLVEIAAPLVVMVFAPGYMKDPYRFHQTTVMLHYTFPYLMMISLTAFAGAVLNTYSKFAVPAFTPVLLNIVMIGAAWWISPHLANPVQGLAIGVFIAGIVQLLFQLPFLHKQGFLVRPRFNWKSPGVRQVLKLMLPAIFGVSVAQLGLLVDTFFASFLPAGSVSWLYYADRFTSFPLGVFAVAIATVVLPQLARHHAAESIKEFGHTMDWAIRMVLLIGVPSALGIFILSGPFLVTLFHSGEFTEHDVLMTRWSMEMFAIGVPSFMLIKVLASGFYSRKDIKTPVRYAVIAMLSNIVLNLILIFPLKHAGLALATSLSATLNATLLCVGLKRQNVWRPGAPWKKYLVQLVSANVLMTATLAYLSPSITQWSDWTRWQCAYHLVGFLVSAMAVYFLVLYVLGLRMNHFLSARYSCVD